MSDDVDLEKFEEDLEREYEETLADMAAESQRIRSSNYISPV